jgi:hypothetical protein
MDAARDRLAFLLQTVRLEAEHLNPTDGRLFAPPFTPARAATLRSDAELSERLDAFVARFARLQDAAGDKLLPALLSRVGEPLGSVLDNLDRAARLGWLVQSSETRLAARTMRNRMVLEHIRNPEALSDAVNAAHAAVPMLIDFVDRCDGYVRERRLI